MTRTPWGDSEQLRERKLAPGYRMPADAVARHQRERLLAAMVAVASERGYDRTTVADVVKLSGVSRTAFYRHFDNKLDCFTTAVDDSVALAMAATAEAYAAAESWDSALRGAFEAFVGQVVAQPAAARACFLEVYVAGREAVAHADRATAAFEQMVAHSFERSERHAGPHPAVPHAIVGGVRRVVFTKLRLDQEADLPGLGDELAAWVRSYERPATPIRKPRLRVAVQDGPRFVAHDQVERIMAAVAAVARDKGYAAMTLDDVAERASMSFSTFYSHFSTKEEAFLAAYDTGAAQAYAAAVPPFQRATDWPRGVRAGLAGFLGYLAREPAWAHAGVVEVLAAGRGGMARRDTAIDTFATLLDPGYEQSPDVAPIASSAIGGAIFQLIYDHILAHGAERLPELLPIATYVALAPFVGADAAGEVANERPGRRARPA